jgi:hypothetical protein
VRAASVGENAVDSAVNHGGLPRSGEVVESIFTLYIFIDKKRN